MLFRGPACLAVDHSVCDQVLDELSGDPAQIGRGLHDRDRVIEGLQVTLQRSGVRRLCEPLTKIIGIVGGQGMSDVGGQLDDRLWPEATIQMIME